MYKKKAQNAMVEFMSFIDEGILQLKYLNFLSKASFCLEIKLTPHYTNAIYTFSSLIIKGSGMCIHFSSTLTK